MSKKEEIIDSICNNNLEKSNRKKMQKVINKYINNSEYSNFFKFIYKASLISHRKYNTPNKTDNKARYYSDLTADILTILDRPFWKSVDTYKKLINNSVKFLKGKIGTTMFHQGPLDPETLKLVKILININKLGFVSTEGQPGDCEYGKNGQISDVEYISYIAGLYPNNRRIKLGNALAKKGYIAAYTGKNDSGVFAPDDKDITNIRMSRNKFKGQTEWDGPNDGWQIAKFPRPSVIDEIFNENLFNWSVENLDSWIIFDTQECREHLIVDLLKILKQFGPIPE